MGRGGAACVELTRSTDNETGDGTHARCDKRCTGPCGSVLGTVGPGFGHGGGRESGVTSWSRLSISQKKEEGCHGD